MMPCLTILMPKKDLTDCAEFRRLREDENHVQNWKRWGTYLAERNGARFARTIPTMAIAGITSATSRPVVAPIAGGRWALRLQ